MSALFVNHLTVLDFSYVHPVRGILGESWIADLELHGELDQQGMVFDFGDVKKQVRDALESLFDHKLVVPAELPALSKSEQNGITDLNWEDSEGRQYRHRSPAEAVLLLQQAHVSPEALTPLLEQAAMAAVPANVKQIRVRLRTEEISGAFYHYSHGLKKHLGNCQRIAHGHRSRIKVKRNGKRDPLLEKAWALKWKDIYIGTKEDLTEPFSDKGVEYCTFAYQAQQGDFELTLPKSKVYLIDTDTTVEYLAEHIAGRLNQDNPDCEIEVKAFEGVMKGAIAVKPALK
ncbi:6-pyruvoyl tetrahydropterin reductase [Ketobacter sp. MCCC 1A13808]|uniref:6-carboxytetrahydropterin synthase n=1 Tax=Ketobacter sp. MCCC 1A13808 TaxID=2602738 RepID=UPI000F244B62|nr:6-carboxytetrahydropterin synthase [Ketobacter sp. MCCC 1A13808]MVF14639.1 6-pyruvoyl tetrahydropterin reductase [Ketobacter sp. MCCC 1A13808]RLP52418.1 MAG: 6-pyruvoyl tetrahydropterin reductase [Ketobacter sp.]